MQISAWVFLIYALATARATRIVTGAVEITRPYMRGTEDTPGFVGRGNPDELEHGWRHLIAYLATCQWCASIWLGCLVFAPLAYWHGSNPAYWPCSRPGITAVAGTLSGSAGRLMAAKPSSTDVAIEVLRTEIARRSGRQCASPGTAPTDACSTDGHPQRAGQRPPPGCLINGAAEDLALRRPGVQLEAWRIARHHGELRVANTIWRAGLQRLPYVAEIDQNGEPGKEVEDPEIAALAQGPLGKGPKKDEALRLLGTNLSVAGEAYIVAEADGEKGGKDLWYVVSGSEIQQAGSRLIITRSAMSALW
jgi:hypothetical protein